eukprot:UN01294
MFGNARENFVEAFQKNVSSKSEDRQNIPTQFWLHFFKYLNFFRFS